MGANNIYNNDDIIAASTRTATLNSLAGYLLFDRGGAPGGSFAISNTSAEEIIKLDIDSPTGKAGIRFDANAVAKTYIGYYGTDGSFGINHGTLSGVAVDAFSISSNNELWVPQLASDNTTAVAGHKIPFVNTTFNGRFDSSGNYMATSYVDAGGSFENFVISQSGKYALTSQDEASDVTVKSIHVESQHNFAGNAGLTDGYGLWMEYQTPTNSEGYNYLQWMDKTSTRYIGSQIQTDSTSAIATKYIGSNISLDDKTGVVINVGEIIAFTTVTGGGPQRVGLYSNVVDDQAAADGEAILTALVTDSGTWAGYFVGCVNIDEGGLVLPSTIMANRPLCNDVSGGTVSERTLWINSADGHLYRGITDVEAGSGATALGGLTDVSLSSFSK